MAKKKYMYMHLMVGKPANFDKEQELIMCTQSYVELVPTLREIRQQQQIDEQSACGVEHLSYGYCKVLLPK